MRSHLLPSGGPLFPLGRAVATPGALAALDLAGVLPEALLARHERGDWGDLGEDDRRMNDEALRAATACCRPTRCRTAPGSGS